MLSLDEFEKQESERNDSLVGDTVDAFQRGAYQSLSGVADFVGLDKISKGLNEQAEAQIKTMTPESQRAMAKSIINEDMSLGEGATDPRTWLLNLASLSGDMATTLLPGGALGKAVNYGGKALKLAETVSGAAKVAKAAQRTNMATNVAMNIASAGGQAGQSAESDILNMDFDDLKDSPVFKDSAMKYIDEGMSNFDALDRAREDLAKQVKEAIMHDPTMATINGVVGHLGDKALGKMVKGAFGKTLKSAVGKSMVTEGTTEAVQGAGQRYQQNRLANEEAGTQLYEPTQGVGAESLESALLGSVAGGGASIPGHGVGILRRNSYEKSVEKVLTPKIIEQSRAAGMNDAEIKDALKTKVTNGALERGFDADEADGIAERTVSAIMGEGPKADERHQAEAEAEQAGLEAGNEEAEQALARQRPEGAEQRDQMVEEARAQREQEQQAPSLFSSDNQTDLVRDSQQALQEIRDAEQADRGNDQLAQLRQGLSRYQDTLKQPLSNEERAAAMNAMNGIYDQFKVLTGQQQQPEPQQTAMFDEETGEVLEQNPETLQEDSQQLGEALQRGDLGFVDQQAQQDAQFREGLAKAMEISPAAVLQVAQMRKSGEMNEQRAISALQTIINSTETQQDTLAVTPEEQALRDQAAMERNQQRVLNEQGQGTHQPNVEESESFQRHQQRLMQGNQEQSYTQGTEGQQGPAGERSVSPLATGIENQQVTNAPQVEFDRWSDVQQGDQNVDQRYGTEYELNPEQEQARRPTVRQPVAKEPVKTPQDWLNQFRGQQAGVLEQPQEKGSARQQKKTEKRKKEEIYQRLGVSQEDINSMQEAIDDHEYETQQFGSVKNTPFALALAARANSAIGIPRSKTDRRGYVGAGKKLLSESSQRRINSQAFGTAIAERLGDYGTEYRNIEQAWASLSKDEKQGIMDAIFPDENIDPADAIDHVSVTDATSSYDAIREENSKRINKEAREEAQAAEKKAKREAEEKRQAEVNAKKGQRRKPVKYGDGVDNGDIKRLSSTQVNIYPYDEARGLRGKPYRIEQRSADKKIVMINEDGKTSQLWEYGGKNGTLREAKEKANAYAKKYNATVLEAMDRNEAAPTIDKKKIDRELKELSRLWDETPANNTLAFDRLTHLRKRFNKVRDGEGTEADLKWAQDWIADTDKGTTPPAKAEVQAPVAQERFSELKTGKSGNPRVQAWLDMQEQDTLDNIKSNADWMGWVSQQMREFRRANGIDEYTSLTPEQNEAFDAELRRVADNNLSDRVHEERANADLSDQNHAAAEKAAQETDTNPTEAQKEAGNYKKGTFSIHGMTIALENPKGSERTGVDDEGNPWSVTMKNHYGYIKRTEGADGDAVDVFVGPNVNSKVVYIIDQVNPNNGEFDEHKVMIGFTRKDSARKAYLDNYEKGWKGLGEFSVVTLDDFKKWLKDGDLSKPYSSELPTPPTPPKGGKKEPTGRTRNQTAPSGKDHSKPKNLGDYTKAILNLDGAELDRDGVIELAQSFRDDHQQMIDELNSMTMPNIKKMMGTYWSMMHSDYKKAQLVKSAYDSLMKNFLFSITDSNFVSTSGQSGVELGDYVVKQIEGVSNEKFAEIQDKRKAKRAEEEAESKRRQEALSNPQTLQDFIAYARNKGDGIHSFTPEQLKQYDKLYSQNRLETKERQRKEAAEVKAVAGEVSYQKAETVHSKLNEPRYVVQLTGERMGKDEFKELANRARQLGGNFINAMQAKRYNTIDGFQFANVEDRDAFARLLDGESVSKEARQQRQMEAKQDSRVTKLKEMAEKMEAEADAAINQDRKTNTAKRAREAGYALDAAYGKQHDARLLNAIADATAEGKTDIIGNLSQKIQLEELQRVRGSLIWDMPEEARERFGYRNEQGNWKLKPETKLDDILVYAKYPTPESRPDRLLRLADSMEQVTGYKQAANKIRSNLKNAGENDKVAMVGRNWDKTVEKIRDFARKNKNEYVAENIAEMFKREDRLNRMGIENPAQLRHALREISEVEKTFKSDRPVETPVTKLENKIIETVRNNRNAYNDFFPTDNESLADSVIETADIQQGMKVLEPNAGMGHLADKIKAKGADLDVGELAFSMSELLKEKGHNVVAGDFLEYNPGPIYDRIVMNPPFSHDADVHHVTHALSMLKPGGRLVAITSSMAGNRSNSANKNFREYLDSVGAVEDPNPEGSFSSSLNPTGVSTKTITIDKPEDAADLPVPDDIRFSQNSVITEPVKGMKAEKVVDEAQKWLDGYEGLKAANVQVVQSQADLAQYVTTDPDATVKAVWMSQDNRVVLVADNLANAQDVRRAMRHELIGHNGLFGNLSEKEAEALTTKVMKLRQNKATKAIFSEVERSYKGAPDLVKAEEVISRLAEQETGKLRQIADRIIAAVMGALRRSGFLTNDKTTLAEIRNMINGTDKYLRKSNGTLSLPDVVRFSQRVDSIPDREDTYQAILDAQNKSEFKKLLDIPKKFINNSKLIDTMKNAAWGTLTFRQIQELAAKKVNKDFASNIDNYINAMNQMQAEEGKGIQKTLDVFEDLDKWRRQDPDRAAKTFDVMHQLTLDNVNPFEDYQDMTPELKEKERILEARLKSRPGEAQAKVNEELLETRRQIKYEPKRKKNLEEAKRTINSLPKESRDVIKKIHDFYASQREEMTDAIMEKVTNLAMEGGKLKKAEAQKIRLDHEIAKKGFYVRLARFGQYYVEGVDENGERVYTMYDTEAQMRDQLKALKAGGFEVTGGKTVEHFAGLDDMSQEIVQKLINATETTTMSESARDEMKDRIYQMYLESMPTRSIRKQYIHRKGVAGFSQDALQALADQGQKQSRQLARFKFEDQMQDSLRGMNASFKAIKDTPDMESERISAARIMDEVTKTNEHVMNPKRAPWASKITGFGFIWMIGTSPASIMTNLVQNVQVALPVIGSRYGTAATSKEMSSLTSDFMKNFWKARKDTKSRRKSGILGSTVLTGDEKLAMEEAIAMGVIDTTQAHDLMGLAENPTSNLTDKKAKVMEWIGAGFHNAEVLNREVTFMTAYRMAKNAGESHEAAAKYATKATWDSHFDYGSLNRARFLRGDIATVAFQFKQYSQAMSYYIFSNAFKGLAVKKSWFGGEDGQYWGSDLFKNSTPEERAEARKQLLGTMMVTFALGGMGALPVTTLAAMANLAHAAFGDDDEPWDAEVEAQLILKEWFGKEFADGIWYGMGTMVGLPNMSNRIEIDPISMWVRPSDKIGLENQANDLTTQLLGPTYSTGMGMLRGADLMLREGKYWKGSEAFLPKWIKDISKVGRYIADGNIITNNNGDVVVQDLTAGEKLQRALGFSPSRESVQWDENANIKEYERLVLDRKKLLLKALWLAHRTEDQQEFDNVLAKIRRFNTSEFGRHTPITSKTINRSFKGRINASERSQNGVQVNSKLLPAIDKHFLQI